MRRRGRCWVRRSSTLAPDMLILVGVASPFHKKKQFGPAYKLCFGPKSFIVISDPVMIRHILRDNAKAYDKGVLAEILEPIMGKGLIPADPATWKVRRRAIVPGFHKAWLNAMVRSGFQAPFGGGGGVWDDSWRSRCGFVILRLSGGNPETGGYLPPACVFSRFPRKSTAA